MTTPNIALIQRVYEGFRARDVAALSQLMAPDVRVRQSAQVPWGGEYHGLAEAITFLGKVTHFIQSAVTVERVSDALEHVVVVGRTAGKVIANEAPFDVAVTHVWGVREGRITSFEVYLDMPAMLAALAK